MKTKEEIRTIWMEQRNGKITDDLILKAIKFLQTKNDSELKFGLSTVNIVNATYDLQVSQTV